MPIARLAKRSLIIFEGPEIRDNSVQSYSKIVQKIEYPNISKVKIRVHHYFCTIPLVQSYIDFFGQFLSKIVHWLVDGPCLTAEN